MSKAPPNLSPSGRTQCDDVQSEMQQQIFETKLELTTLRGKMEFIEKNMLTREDAQTLKLWFIGGAFSIFPIGGIIIMIIGYVFQPGG